MNDDINQPWPADALPGAEKAPETPAEHPAIKDYSLRKQQKRSTTDLKALNVSELLSLRDEIDVLLPPISLKSFNLVEQVLINFHKARELLGEVQNDESIPTNQKAQVLNTVASSLKEISKMRNEVYGQEQNRLMEAALNKALKLLPKEAQDVFFEAYRKIPDEMAVALPLEMANAGP